jgi:hypothetical protein
MKTKYDVHLYERRAHLEILVEMRQKFGETSLAVGTTIFMFG